MERWTPPRIPRAFHAKRAGIRRTFGVARQTLARWLKQKAKAPAELVETLDPARADDVIELDELWSFVSSKDNQRWVWIAPCRRTRQIGAFVVGDRSDASCTSYRIIASPKPTDAVVPLAIFGTPTRKSWPRASINRLAKTVGRRIMWSAGTISPATPRAIRTQDAVFFQERFLS